MHVKLLLCAMLLSIGLAGGQLQDAAVLPQAPRIVWVRKGTSYPT